MGVRTFGRDGLGHAKYLSDMDYIYEPLLGNSFSLDQSEGFADLAEG